MLLRQVGSEGPSTAMANVTRNCSACSEQNDIRQDDAVWILSSSFIIFTMQSGFGLLESGSVSARNEINIMVKNMVDVLCGGLAYWAFGYGLSFGSVQTALSGFSGFGDFFFDAESGGHVDDSGWRYASFIFQLSFATTATTVVSGAMAERTKLKSYMVFASLVVLIHSMPAHWVWAEAGFLRRLGVIDIAGAAPVHLVGGSVGAVATLILKPRAGRFDGDGGQKKMSNPTNALLGTFMLWWGWLGFNCGSTWGITGGRWTLAAKSAVATIMSSIGGGIMALILSFVTTKMCRIDFLIDGILSALVSITAMCALARPWQSLLIGAVGSALAMATAPLLEWLKIDDPVGIIPVHFVGAVWGLLAVGLLVEPNAVRVSRRCAVVRDVQLDVQHIDEDAAWGLLYGGGVRLLGVQALAILCVLLWSVVVGAVVLIVLRWSRLGLRVSAEKEEKGADVVEHGLSSVNLPDYIVRPTSGAPHKFHSTAVGTIIARRSKEASVVAADVAPVETPLAAVNSHHHLMR